MQTPLDITFRGMSPSASVEGAIRQWVARLDRTYGRIQGYSVTIEQPHHHQRRGNLFHVHVNLTIPGRDITVSREPARNSDHENAYVAVSDAFRAARRQLQDHTKMRRGDVRRQAA